MPGPARCLRDKITGTIKAPLAHTQLTQPTGAAGCPRGQYPAMELLDSGTLKMVAALSESALYQSLVCLALAEPKDRARHMASVDAVVYEVK